MLHYHWHRSAVLLTTIFTLCTTGLTANAQATNAPNTVNINANQQLFEDDGTTLFKGNVKVSYLDFTINSNEAKVELDGAGQPSVAIFYPRPDAHHIAPVAVPGRAGTKDDLEADIIRLFLNESRMRAEGNSVSYITTVAANPVTIHADTQVFDNRTKVMNADGSVKVDYNDTVITSPKATMWMNNGKRAEKVSFTNGAKAVQKGTTVTGGTITIITGSGNMIAEHGVTTRVTKPGKNAIIKSAYQQYDKGSDTMLASGNVAIDYKDYKAYGPKATFKMKSGDLDKILMTGRSKIITDDGRQVEADTIVITTNPKHFDAKGNVKTKFLAKQQPAAKPVPKAAPKATGTKGATSFSVSPKPTSPAIDPDAPTDDYL
jgi:lipopolysaccharide export system protein LptA